jgi:hypothetical protein
VNPDDYKLRIDDVLYRRVNQLTSIEPDLSISPAAFFDPPSFVKGQSFFVKRIIKSPRGVMEWFCALKHMIQQNGGVPPKPEELCLKWGICVVPASLFIGDARFQITTEPNGDEIRSDGHINTRGVSEQAQMVAAHPEVRALPMDEILA